MMRTFLSLSFWVYLTWSDIVACWSRRKEAWFYVFEGI